MNTVLRPTNAGFADSAPHESHGMESVRPQTHSKSTSADFAAPGSSRKSQSATSQTHHFAYVEISINQHALIVRQHFLIKLQIPRLDCLRQFRILHYYWNSRNTIEKWNLVRSDLGGSRPKIIFTGIKKNKIILRSTGIPKILEIMRMSGIAMIQRQGEQIMCFEIIVFIQPNTTIIIIIGTLLTICPQIVHFGFWDRFRVRSKFDHCNSRKCPDKVGNSLVRREF